MDMMVPTYRPNLLNAALAFAPAPPVPEPAAALPALRTASRSFRGALRNPFRDATALRFTPPAAGHVTLRLYNVVGQRVRTLVDGDMPAGEQSVTLRGEGLPVGMYFTSLQTRAGNVTRSVILVR